MTATDLHAAELDRAEAALTGLAIGDALGMPTQLLARDEVIARYGPRLEWFAAAPADHPVAAGLAAGSVTDDTEQAVLLGQLLVEGDGHIEPRRWARALQDWEADMVSRGSADLLGPSTRRALAAIATGVAPEEAGREGDTNGAAMRIAPVGIAVAIGHSGGPDNFADLVRLVVPISRVTHGTDVALAGAVAVAAAVSAGVGGSDLPTAIELGTRAAAAGAAAGHRSPHPDLGPLIGAAVALARESGDGDLESLVQTRIGTGMATTESIPAAFAVLAAFPADPWTACRVAASLGGDSDTIAAIVGAVGGACCGLDAFPVTARRLVQEVNGLDLAGLAAGLLALRRAA